MTMPKSLRRLYKKLLTQVTTSKAKIKTPFTLQKSIDKINESIKPKMNIVTVSSKYQISIPSEIRATHQIKPGQKLGIIELDGQLYLHPLKSLDQLEGTLPGLNQKNIRDKNDRL